MLTSDQHDQEIESKAKIYSILLVDDDPETALETKEYLDSQGYFVKIVGNGGQAHSQLRVEKSDFVILKLILPDESGFEICERIKREFQWLPVLIWTEITLEVARRLAEHVQADGYLTRPCELDLLKQTIVKVSNALWEKYEESKMDANTSLKSDKKRVAIASEQSGSHPALVQEFSINSPETDPSLEKKKNITIRFRCSCDKELHTSIKNRGRFIYCTRCQERIRVPNYTDQDFIDESTDEGEETAHASDPMKFVSIRCQYCSTLFRLYTSELSTNRVCPRCHKSQTGALSIKGIPLARAALASSMRLLRICSGEQKGKKLLLPEKKVVLGKGKKASLQFPDPKLEDRHCILLPVEKGVLVKDLDSASGTFINEKRIEGKALLRPRYVLRVGDIQLRLLAKDRSTEDAMKRIQKWSAEEDAASENGDQVFRHNISVPVEAAAVIEMHWDYSRKKRLEERGNVENDL